MQKAAAKAAAFSLDGKRENRYDNRNCPIETEEEIHGKYGKQRTPSGA